MMATQTAVIDETTTTQRQVAIVLVEDEPAVRTILIRALGRVGYIVHAFERGEAAVEFARDSSVSIDLLIVDSALPGISGIETAAQILAIRPTLPVLRTSGYSNDLYEGNGAPVSAFLQKPFTTEVLYAELRALLGHVAAAATQTV